MSCMQEVRTADWTRSKTFLKARSRAHCGGVCTKHIREDFGETAIVTFSIEKKAAAANPNERLCECGDGYGYWDWSVVTNNTDFVYCFGLIPEGWYGY